MWAGHGTVGGNRELNGDASSQRCDRLARSPGHDSHSQADYNGGFSIGDNFFAPDEVTVAVGSTVTWQINAGEIRTMWSPLTARSARIFR